MPHNPEYRGQESPEKIETTEQQPNQAQRETVEFLRNTYKNNLISEQRGHTAGHWGAGLGFENEQGTGTKISWEIQPDGKVEKIMVHRSYEETDEPLILDHIANAWVDTDEIQEIDSYELKNPVTGETYIDKTHSKTLLTDERKFLEEALAVLKNI